MPNNKNDDMMNKKINPKPKDPTNIGIDTQDDFWKALTQSAESANIDISAINNFSQISQNRETLYNVLDTMSEDPTIAAALEIYTEDVTAPNEQGDIMWVTSNDDSISKYVTYLLNSLNVDKNLYRWAYSLIKYGDIYLRLYRESDFNDALLNKDQKTSLNEKFNNIEDTKNPLNEETKIIAYSKNDRLVNYIDMNPNPAEMFELTKFGKSYAYIKTNSTPINAQQNESTNSTNYYLYKFKQQDIEIYNAVSYVHGCLQDDTPRQPEQIQIFMDGEDADSYTYTVRRGQSILYHTYKIWRIMMLLDNALLLNRLTKSSILRVIEVEVADMPKERVGPHLQRIKSMIEQKSSLDTGNKMSEYTNPGPMENNIYVPTHNGTGAISTQQIGGDVNVRDIADIDYFKNQLYASLKIPKQYLGDTDDATGFNGGTSLSIISSRYAKTVSRIQTVLVQTIKDAINILLLDRGMDSYVNKFDLHMQPPTTQEDLDRRESESGKIQITDDIMRIVDGEIDEPLTKIKILKSLLSNAITDQEVIGLLQDEIDKLEAEQAEEEESETDIPDTGEDNDDFDLGSLGGGGGGSVVPYPAPSETGGEEPAPTEEPEPTGGGGGEETLPTPSEANPGVDMSEQ